LKYFLARLYPCQRDDGSYNRRYCPCAPETSHAIAAVIDEALKAKEEGKEKNILFCYSGHGLMDLTGYDAYLSGKLTDYELPEEELDKYSECLKDLPKPPMNKTVKW
jgi:hypothetical protein